MCMSWSRILSQCMCLGLCVSACRCRLVVLLVLCWVLGSGSVLSVIRAGGQGTCCSARRACGGFIGRVVELHVRCLLMVGCVVSVLWLCLSLLVVPHRTNAAGNGARAHGVRAKVGAKSFFLSFNIPAV